MRISVKHRADAEAPLIITAAARENLVLRAFVRQAVPMLKSPEAYSASQRLQLATTLQRAVPGCEESNDTKCVLTESNRSALSSSEYVSGMD